MSAIDSSGFARQYPAPSRFASNTITRMDKNPEFSLPNRFVIAQCPEWQFLRSPHMTLSASVDQDKKQYQEEARSSASLYVQEQLHAGDHTPWRTLIAQQTHDVLQHDEYMELWQLSHYAMPDIDTYEAVQYVNLTHDIAKNHQVMRAVDLDPAYDSHDEGLRRLFLPEYRNQQSLFLPTYANPRIFTAKQRRIIEGAHTSPFNFVRFMQSQLARHEIDHVTEIDLDVLAVIVMHGIHDIGGAMGHKNLRSSLTLNSPTANRVLDAALALLGSPDTLGFPPDTPLTPAARHLTYLMLCAQRLGIQTPDTFDYADVPELITRLSIANLLKCHTPQDFASADAAFRRLPEILRHTWTFCHVRPLGFGMEISAGNTNGTDYAPAFLRSMARGGEEELSMVLGYFSQVIAHVNALPFEEAALTNRSWASASHYTHINFYHLAQWCAAHKNNYRDIAVTYHRRGDTITPIPHNPHSYKGAEPLKHLLHPDAFSTA